MGYHVKTGFNTSSFRYCDHCCSHNCCCNNKHHRCDETTINSNNTTVHRKTIINNFDSKHEPIGYHNHQAYCCGATYVDSCGVKGGRTARCLNPTLYCVETTDGNKSVTIKSGTMGTLLAEVNQQLFQVKADDILTISGNVLSVNGTAQSVATLYPNPVNTVDDGQCCSPIDFSGTDLKLFIVNDFSC